MRGKKVDGTECIKCGNTVRYALPSGSTNKEGACVVCKVLSSEKLQATKSMRYQASEGIKEPYRKCYEQGFAAAKDKSNPYPTGAIGKYCAWQAGYNDHN